MTTNSTVLVILGLVSWWLSYLWLVEVGPETLTTLIRAVLGTLPLLGIVASLSVSYSEWQAHGPLPTALPMLLLAVALAFLCFYPNIRTEVHAYLVDAWAVGKKLSESRHTERPYRIQGVVVQLLSALLTALAFVAIGAGGIWGGYQLAFGSVATGIVLFVVIVAASVLQHWGVGRWNLVHNGTEILHSVRECNSEVEAQRQRRRHAM